jgi:hypothetical protein
MNEDAYRQRLMAALLGYKAEAIPLALEDPLFIVEGVECREQAVYKPDSCYFFSARLIWQPN